jgi:hypothetical protein
MSQHVIFSDAQLRSIYGSLPWGCAVAMALCADRPRHRVGYLCFLSGQVGTRLQSQTASVGRLFHFRTGT